MHAPDETRARVNDRDANDGHLLEYAESARPNYNCPVPEADSVDITGLLKAWRQGDQTAFDQLMPLVYAQLRGQAQRQMRKERSGLTLQSTAVVHEVYLRLTRAQEVDCQDRVHFFALAAQVMRRVLVDAARARTALKRGGGVLPTEHSTAVDLDSIASDDSTAASSVCALHEALEMLTQIDPRRAKVIELRFFGGLSVDETAEVLHVSPQTVMRDWRLARAWLARELRRSELPASRGA